MLEDTVFPIRVKLKEAFGKALGKVKVAPIYTT